MTDFDSIWRTQDEIRTVVNAVLGECIWNLAYDERRSAIVLELTFFLDEDAISNLCYKEGNRITTIPRSPLSRHMIEASKQP